MDHVNFLLKKLKPKCKYVFGHWFGFFILCAPGTKFHNLQFWVKMACSPLQLVNFNLYLAIAFILMYMYFLNSSFEKAQIC